MKKITLLFTAMVFGFAVNAQTLSFEASEGYTLGNINGQSNWTTIGDGAGGFIANQTISSDLATAGTNAIKLVNESAFGGQQQPIVGAFYTYPTPISNDDATFSADINITEQSAASFISQMSLVNLTTSTYRTYINFFYNGTINVFVKGGATGIQVVPTGATWTANAWFNIKIKTAGETVTFFKDGVQIYEGLLVTAGPIDQVRFSHDNYSGIAYIDNFRTNDEPLSVNSVIADSDFSHFYNKDSKLLAFNSSKGLFDNVSVFNVLGQNVIEKNLADGSQAVDMSGLANGVYVVKLTLESSTKTFKVLKQ